MRIMGMDLGNKTLGVALSDPTGLICTGYPTIRFKNRDFETALNEAMKFIKEHEVEKIVLGLPKNMDGTEGIQAETSRNFKKMLEDATGLEVILFDERLTSRIALDSMIMGGTNRQDRHDKIDEMAAEVILQDYLDKIRRENK